MNVMDALRQTITAIKNWTDENKVQKVNGKGLSTNDYTTEDKDKVAEIPNNLVVRDGKLYLAQDNIPMQNSGVDLPNSNIDLNDIIATKEYVDNIAATKQPIGDYLTSIPSEYVTETELSAKGYLTKYIETDPTVPAWAKASTKPTYTASEVGALPNTTVIPTVPTKVSAFANDAGYLTEHQSLKGLATEDYVNSKLQTIPTPDVSGQINDHNIASDSHADIREQINQISLEKATVKYVDEKVVLALANTKQLEVSYASNIEECIDTSKVYVLPDGYIYAYFYGDSSEPSGPVESGNLLPSATDTDRTTIYNGTGYKSNSRLSHSGGGTVSTQTDAGSVSGFIPASVGDVLKITGLIHDSTNTWSQYVMAYDSSNKMTGSYDISNIGTELTLTLSEDIFGSSFNAIRFSADGIDANTSVTITSSNMGSGDTLIGSPSYTNILDGTELHLNQRWSVSSLPATLKSQDGYVATDYLKAKPGDVVRVNRNITNATYDKNRVVAFNAEKSGIAYGGDGILTYYAPVTDEGDGVYSFVFGQKYKTDGNSSSGTYMVTTIADEGYMLFNIGISGSKITEADVADLVITLNEPIVENEVPDPAPAYGWHNTGIPFVPAEYEDRIVALENKINNSNTIVDGTHVFAPSPQLPANGNDEADFNAGNMTAQDIYNYVDALCEKYPNYITKEVLGKDASNTYDVNRYVLSRHYYKAWQQENYPKMYGWVNGSTVIYSQSISPRIGDTMYSTAYVGTTYANVTAVNNANQSRTVNNIVFTRDSSKDVEPTLVYTSIINDAIGNTVYKQNKTTATTISTITSTILTGKNGISYIRYPMGDRNKNMEHLTVVTIGANEHGFTPDPREPAIVCSRLMKDLCECRNADNEFLNYLKNDVMLIVVPVINPYGFNRSDGAGYYNKNGVNINRNYDCPGWGNLDDTGTGAQGTYGGSEVETQYFMNTISEPKSAVAISVHALGYTANGGNVLCHYQGNNFNATKIGNIAEIMAANYNMKFTDYGTTPPTTNQGGKSPAYITWAGAVGGLIEMQAEGASSERNTAYVLEADYTLLLQCIHMWLTDYEEANV